MLEHLPVVFVGHQVGRDIEQFAQPLVLHQPLPGAIHHQDAVEGGVGLRFQKCGLGVEFGLRLFPPCDVAKKAIGVEHSVFFVSTHGAVLDPDPGSIFSANAVFLVKGNLPVKKSPIGLMYSAKILGVDETHPEMGPTGTDFCLAVPQHRLHLWADVNRPAVPVGGPSHIGRTRQDSAKLLLALAAHLSRLLYLGDVFNGGHMVGPSPRGIARRRLSGRIRAS